MFSEVERARGVKVSHGLPGRARESQRELKKANKSRRESHREQQVKREPEKVAKSHRESFREPK